MSPCKRPFTILVVARILIAFSCLFAFASAHALSFCASNADLLSAALNLGSAQTSPYTIMIVQGTYLMDDASAPNMSAPTTLLGGYTANCASRVVDPANTIIDIGAGNTLNLVNLEAAPEAQINVDGLTFQHGAAVHLTAGKFNPWVPDSRGSVHVTRSRFTQLTGGNSQVSVGAYDGDVVLENVLIDHVSASDAPPNNCPVFVQSDGGGGRITINHVTADLAGGDDVCLYDAHEPVPMYIFNSILWNSDGGVSRFVFDVDADSQIAFFNSIYATWAGGGSVSEEGKLASAPEWFDPMAGNYRLRTNPLSPAINSGSVLVPGGEPMTDIEGHVRRVGSATDRGAYESAYNDQATLTVTNLLDSGPGTLRQALIEANSTPSVAKRITFDIRDSNQVSVCPAVIALSSVLPTIASTVTIDGYSQTFSTLNTDTDAFNANLCVLLKPASGTLSTGFHIPASTGPGASLTLRGLGMGGFGQPLLILGGSYHVIAGNQFGGMVNGVNLPGAGINAISIGLNASGSLIVGGQNLADRNVIGGAAANGVDVQTAVHSSTERCQIVNNLIGLAANGVTEQSSAYGINLGGSGCAVVRNRIAGNSNANILLNGTSYGNVVQQNLIGINAQGNGLFNNAIGISVSGSDNIIGAAGNGGQLTANTIRFNVAGGVVVKGNAATGNSIHANLIYDNGATGDGMDIDLIASDGIAGPTVNDPSDADVGPNQLQNFPMVTGLVYAGSGNDGGHAIVTGFIDTLPGPHRIAVYFSNTTNPQGKRAHAEVFLAGATVDVPPSGRAVFSIPVTVPNQSAGGVIGMTATDNLANTSEIGTATSTDTLLKDGFE